MTGLGTIVAGGHTFKIQRITLGEGLLHLAADAPGPCKYLGGELDYSVYGPDGELFITAQGVRMPRFSASKGRVAHADFTLSMNDKIGTPI